MRLSNEALYAISHYRLDFWFDDGAYLKHWARKLFGEEIDYVVLECVLCNDLYKCKPFSIANDLHKCSNCLLNKLVSGAVRELINELEVKN